VDLLEVAPPGFSGGFRLSKTRQENREEPRNSEVKEGSGVKKPSTEHRALEEHVLEQKPFNSVFSADELGRPVERMKRYPTKAERASFPLVARIFFWLFVALYVAGGIMVVLQSFL
jgi:hypothetical protein